MIHIIIFKLVCPLFADLLPSISSIYWKSQKEAVDCFPLHDFIGHRSFDCSLAPLDGGPKLFKR